MDMGGGRSKNLVTSYFRDLYTDEGGSYVHVPLPDQFLFPISQEEFGSLMAPFESHEVKSALDAMAPFKAPVIVLQPSVFQYWH